MRSASSYRWPVGLLFLLGPLSLASMGAEVFRVDLGCPGKPETFKEGWTPWTIRNGCDDLGHGEVALLDIDGTGINAYIATLDDQGYHNLQSRIAEPIANSAYLCTGYHCDGHPAGSIQLRLNGPGLLPGGYFLKTYHIWSDLPAMASVQVTGETMSPVSRYNVQIANTLTDTEVAVSNLRFHLRDPGEVIAIYEAAPGSTACINAFVLNRIEPTFQFQQSDSEGLETQTPIWLSVLLKYAFQDQTYTVDYERTGGTATPGLDYILPGYCPCDSDRDGFVNLRDIGLILDHWLQPPGPYIPDFGTDGRVTFADFAVCAGRYKTDCFPSTLTFNPGETSKTIGLEIMDDGLDEPDETVEVRLLNATGPDIALDRQSHHSYTILDMRPKVSFAEGFSENLEQVTPVYIPVLLSHAGDKPVKVDYAVADGTATGDGVDYTLSPSTLVFEPGITSLNISLDIVGDLLQEADETVQLILRNPVNALPGKKMSHIYSILDDEAGLPWDEKIWYYSDDPSRIFVNPAGALEWDVQKGGQFIARVPEQRLSQPGDAVEFSYMWMTDGEHDCTDCFRCPDSCFDDDITCIAGTSDMRVGLFEADGEYIDDDGMGTGNDIFRGYKGYNFRFGPNMLAGPNRWVDCTNEVHKTGNFGKKPPESDSLMIANEGLLNYIDGFELPPGQYSPLTVRIERLSSSSIRLSITLNGRTQTCIDNSGSNQPQKIDVFAVYMRNGRPYSRLVLARPE